MGGRDFVRNFWFRHIHFYSCNCLLDSLSFLELWLRFKICFCFWLVLLGWIYSRLFCLGILNLGPDALFSLTWRLRRLWLRIHSLLGHGILARLNLYRGRRRHASEGGLCLNGFFNLRGLLFRNFHLARVKLRNLNYGLRVIESFRLLEAAWICWFCFYAWHIPWRHNNIGATGRIHLIEEPTRWTIIRSLVVLAKYWWLTCLLFCRHSLLPHKFATCFFFFLLIWVRSWVCNWHTAKVNLRAEEVTFFILLVQISLNNVVVLNVILQCLLECVLAKQHLFVIK